MSKGGGNQIIGYWYSLGLHMITCLAADKLLQVKGGGRVAWAGEVNISGGTRQQIYIDALDLYGGEEAEGGIQGYMDVEFGEATQTKNSYLLSVLGSRISAHRGLMGFVWRRGRLGAFNKYLKPLSFVLGRRSASTDGSATYEWIGQDANPAYIIYECATNPDWGMGYPASSVELATVEAAAAQLYAESFGLSMLWTTQVMIEEFIQLVLDHIAGTFQPNAATGKFELLLIRQEDNPVVNFTADENNVYELVAYERPGWGDTVNQISLVYSDNNTANTSSVTVHEPANIAIQGRVVSKTIELLGINNADLAARVAWRELSAVSTPLARATLRVNKKLWNLRPDELFYFSWAARGIGQVTMRCVSVELGEFDSDYLTVQAVEDVFSLESVVYAKQQTPLWVAPNSAPAPPTYYKVEEAGYYDLALLLGDTDAQALDPDVAYTLALAARDTGDSYRWKLYSRVNPVAYALNGVGSWSPVGTLDAALNDQSQGTINITAVDYADFLNAGLTPYGMIGDEKVEVLTVADMGGGAYQLTVNRGVLDTTPSLSHPAGTLVWMVNQGAPAAKTVTALTTEQLNNHIRPVTSLGELSEANSVEVSFTAAQRQYRPYPPGKVRVTGQAFPTAIVGDINLTWEHRDRLLQTAYLVDQEAVSIGPEAGTTYNVRLRHTGGAVVHSQTGITGTSYSRTSAQWQADFGGTGPYDATIEIEAQRDGVTSWTAQERQFTLS